MGSDKKKKERERFLLDRFLEYQGISILAADIQPLEPPHPDFLIVIQGRKVGIELTELFVRPRKSQTHSQPGKPNRQEVESITNRIVCKAREIYFDAGHPPVCSQVVFSTAITLDKKKADQIAMVIAGKIQSMTIENSQNIEWRPSEDESEETLLSEAVASIHVCGVPEIRSARWTVARAGWAAALTAQHLQNRIDEKAKRINGYKTSTEEIWLLIVADRRQPSQNFACGSNFSWDSLFSPFERTFYFGYPDTPIEF